MLGWFRRRKEPVVPPDPKAWQLHWHGVLNTVPNPDGEPPGVPAPLPDMDSDYRLLFNIWHVDAQARRRAFSVFPCHDAMLARIEKHLGSKPQAIGPDEAIEILRRGLGLLNHAGIEAPEASVEIVILDESKLSLHEAFSQADSPFLELNRDLRDRALQQNGEAGQKAFYFLSEPFYRVGTTYSIAHWLSWPLCASPKAPDLTEADYRLWQGGWSPGWSSDRVFLFDRREEFKLTRA